MSKQPNVLFVLSDQHNAKYLGFTGMTDVITPTFDRMAAEGVWFSRAYTQVTICGPSRVAFHSGQYPHNSGRFGFGGPRPEAPTVFGHFRRAGYRTACVGKMHCPHGWLEDDCDEFYETDRTSRDGSCKEYLDYMAARGVNVYDEYNGGIASRGHSPFDYEDSQEGWGARQVIDIMQRSTADNQPFFIHYSLTKPHQPYKPARQFWHLYDENDISLPPNADYDLHAAGKAPVLIDVSEGLRQGPDFEAGRMAKLHGYLGNVSHCDHALGQVLDHLEQAGLAENTIIVYSADHGEYACEHGPGEKVPGIAADAVVRVPMLWWWPGHFSAGCASDVMTEAIDVAATVCSLAGVGIMDTADGVDLTPALNGSQEQLRTVAVTDHLFSKSVRKGKWRMVYYPPLYFADRRPDGFGELYDLDADPWEMQNLYFDPEFSAVVREMERDLLDWQNTTLRPVTVFNPGRTGADGKVRIDDIRDSCPNPAYI